MSGDLATSLDIKLSDEQETKFQALKMMYAMKCRSLMSSIDAKDKEIVKLKVLGKDNRRTQMIEALKTKIRECELVLDVVKTELSSRAEMSPEQVSELIIRKTLGGPKRFRPLTREEMELKISDLEKKIKRNNISTTFLNDKTSDTNIAQVSSKVTQNITKDIRDNTINSDYLVKIDDLSQEVTSLKISLNNSNNLIEKYKEEIIRLRKRNSELCVSEEQTDYQEKIYNEQKEKYQLLSKELIETTNNLAIHIQELMQLRAKSDFDIELLELDKETLQEKYEQLLNQNTVLLKKLATYEIELESHNNSNQNNQFQLNQNELSNEKLMNIINNLNNKIIKLNEKILLNENQICQLTNEKNKIPLLMDTLREKNLMNRDLQRIIDNQKASNQQPKDKISNRNHDNEEKESRTTAHTTSLK